MKMENAAPSSRLHLLTLFASSLVFSALFYFIEEKTYSFYFLQFDNETFSWVIMTAIVWGLSIAIFHLLLKVFNRKTIAFLISAIFPSIPPVLLFLHNGV